jgi:radical SAM protein with 4Fe4S-binding SPASM domain
MDFDLYKKIISDINEFEKPIKVLRLYKDGEPLLNGRFPDMVRYAKENGNIERIDTTTNGSLLSPYRSKKIIDAGLDLINISVDGLSDEQFKSFTRAKVSFNKYVENIRFFYEHKGDCEVFIKIAGNCLNEEEKKKFFDTFGDIADRIFIENFAPCWPEFDVEKHTGVKISGGIYQNPLTNIQVCPYIFYSMSVNSDGTASLCFLDWSRRLVIGDVKKQSMKEIWNGENLLHHQILHLNGNRKSNEQCASCGQLTHCLPDNIDPYAKEILERINEKL